MKSQAKAGSSFRVAFVMDDRLPHDRKTVFARTVTMMKSKFSLDVFSSNISEDELLNELKKHHYGLVILPWYHYVSWKKVEAHFGSLRMQGSTVAGYFADAILPFEFSNHPNYHRFILLDFYRFDQTEIEWVMQSLIAAQRRSGFSGLFARNTAVYYAEWYDDDATPTRSIDTLMKHPLLQNATWGHRLLNIRLYMTALWSLCYEKRHSMPSKGAAATLEIAEVNRRLVIKLLFESADLTLHSMMEQLWPNSPNPNATLRELTRNSDYLRIHQFPESQQVEVTAFFTPGAPSIQYPNELRGWWIEPLVKKYVKTAEDEMFVKRVPISAHGAEAVGEQLQQIVETLRTTLMQVTTLSPEERAAHEQRFNNIKFLVQEMDKKMLQKKAS